MKCNEQGHRSSNCPPRNVVKLVEREDKDADDGDEYLCELDRDEEEFGEHG